jgi:hypothetical protein
MAGSGHHRQPDPQLLTAQSAVVLQRIARGGAATTWYRGLNQAHLDAITAQLSPGSVVSFHLDDRIAYRRYTLQLHQQLLNLIGSLQGLPGETGEIVVGHLAADEWSVPDLVDTRLRGL